MGILGIDLGEFAKDIANAVDTIISPDPEAVAARQEGRTARVEARQEGRTERQGNRQDTRSVRSIAGNSLNDVVMRHSDNITGLLQSALPLAAGVAAASAGVPLGGLLGGAQAPAPSAPPQSQGPDPITIGALALLAVLALRGGKA